MKKNIMATLAVGTMFVFSTPMHAQEELKVANVEFIGMDAPKEIPQMATVYTTAKMRVTYTDGTVKEQPLSYSKLYQSDEKIVTNKGQKIAAGTPVDRNGNPIVDTSVPAKTSPYISDAPDANSLLHPFSPDGFLYLVTHFEYDSIDNAGNSAYGKVPASLTISKLTQNKDTGALQVIDATKADVSSGNGQWIPCNGSLSPWNTHLSSEEYEPDARTFEENVEDRTNVKSFANLYFGDVKKANPYYYGFIPEVIVQKDGSSKVIKHYSTGRKSNELMKMMPDKRTAYFGDDGSYTTMFMYIADQEENLSAGTLYAAKFHQTRTENGGAGNLEWIPLGHATDAEVQVMIDRGMKFSDIFETSDIPKEGFKAIRQYSYGKIEYIRLKRGMEKAAAFLESRRYAAYMGATAEFNKMEGLTLNEKDNKVYMAISDVSKGMEDSNGKDPVDDIKLPKMSTGATFQLDLSGNQKDATGNGIASNYVATTMSSFLIGEDLKAPDPYGNTANPDKIANPDNLSYSEEMRTLFIGEDSGKHINNFLWAYQVDTKKLSRILSVPAGAEATGLQVADNRNGFSYIMSNFQHPGDELDNYKPTAIDMNALKAEISKGIGIDEAGMVGYISIGNLLHVPIATQTGTTPPPPLVPTPVPTPTNVEQSTATTKENMATNTLPDTATPMYTTLGLGALVAIAGGLLYRRKA